MPRLRSNRPTPRFRRRSTAPSAAPLLGVGGVHAASKPVDEARDRVALAAHDRHLARFRQRHQRGLGRRRGIGIGLVAEHRVDTHLDAAALRERLDRLQHRTGSADTTRSGRNALSNGTSRSACAHPPSSSGRIAILAAPIAALAGLRVPHQHDDRVRYRHRGEVGHDRCARRDGSSGHARAPACATRRRRPRRWARNRRRGAASPSTTRACALARPGSDTLPMKRETATFEPVSSRDLAHRGREFRLVLVQLALGQRPVVVARAVHQRDLDAALAHPPHHAAGGADVRYDARAGTSLLAAVSELLHQQLLVVDACSPRAYPLTVRLQIPGGDVPVEREVEASCPDALARRGRSTWHSTSTRRSRLRCMRSAEPIQYSGSPSPPK